MIEVQGLRYRYPQAQCDALNGVDLNIREGSIVAIMGSNGSGKSTLARCLNGLLVPTAGTVRVDGMQTGNPANMGTLRRRVGLVFQNPTLQMTSVTVERELAFGLENIRMNRDEMHTRVDAYLRMFGFQDRRNDSPSSLSAGERQRLAVASVMILDPSYLVLDEATSLLAMRSRLTLLEMVETLHRESNVAVVLITQYPSEALHCERLLVLHNGSVVMDDVPEAVFSNSGALLGMGIPIPMRHRLKVA